MADSRIVNPQFAAMGRKKEERMRIAAAAAERATPIGIQSNLGVLSQPVDLVALAKEAAVDREPMSSTILGRSAATSPFNKWMSGIKQIGESLTTPRQELSHPTYSTQPSLADVEVPGSRTASTEPMVVQPPVTKRHAATVENIDRSSYQLPDVAKDFTMVPDEGVASSTAFDAQGNSMQGINKPGGTFKVVPGPGASTPGYADMSNEDKIKANVAAYQAQGEQRNAKARAQSYMDLPENQRGRIPDDVADVLGIARAPAREETATPDTSLASAMDDYLSGRVGSQGYNKIRALKMQRESALGSIPQGRDRRRAMAKLAADPLGLERVGRLGGREQTDGLTPANQISLARMGLDNQFKSLEAQRKSQNDLYTRQKDAYQRRRDAVGDSKEQLEGARAEVMRMVEARNFPVEVQGLAPDLLNRAVLSGKDPYEALDTMNGLLRQDTPEMQGLRKSLMDDDPAVQAQAQATFTALYARQWEKE